MRQDDFVDIMKEVVPELIEQAIMSDTAREPALKRSHEDVERSPADEPASSSSRAKFMRLSASRTALI